MGDEGALLFLVTWFFMALKQYWKKYVFFIIHFLATIVIFNAFNNILFIIAKNIVVLFKCNKYIYSLMIEQDPYRYYLTFIAKFRSNVFIYLFIYVRCTFVLVSNHCIFAIIFRWNFGILGKALRKFLTVAII